jgi:restriction endonuclease S subunit
MRDSWIETKLVDAVEVLDRFRKPVNSTEREGRQGSIPYYGANGRAGWIDDSIFNEELVLLGEDAINFADPTARKAYLISGPSWVNNHAHVLRARPEKVFSYFLAESLNKVDYSQYVSFGTRSKLTQGSMNGIKILLPPLSEQRRIVDLISSVDSYIEALQKHLGSAKRSRNAVLHELLTAGGDDWVETTLGKLLTLEYGKSLTDKNRDGNGFPVYASAGVVGLHSEPLVSKSPVIVVGRKGTAGAVYWSGTPCFVIDTAYYVEPISDIDLGFLYLLLTFIDLKSVTAQTGVPGLNRDRAYSLKCNVPPKSKQVEIVEIVTQLDLLIDSTQGTINRAQDLRSGLLSDLLSGNHEIPTSYDKVMGAA